MPIDYSKWKDIEVSDDEDDTHPNIDTPSLFRWRHQARLERMAEMEHAKEEVVTGKTKVSSRMQEIENKLAEVNLDDKIKIQLELEKAEILKQEEEFRKKEKELADKERLVPWNVDTIGHEAWSKSVINKASNKKHPEESKHDDDDESEKMLNYFKENEAMLEKFASLSGFDKVEEFLLDHPHIASESATSWLTLEALNRAIEEKFDEMNKMIEQCITVQYLLELAKSLHALPTNTNFIKHFFKKIRAADAQYLNTYREEVKAMEMRVRKRAKDKCNEAMTEADAEEKKKRIEESPGGLDPVEVFESLPEEMREAFASQNVQALEEIAQIMDKEVFQYHLKRCTDSGLWVPDANDSN